MKDDEAVKTITDTGDIIWKDSEGNFHYDDGPCVLGGDGTLVWYHHGKFHREDGPAIIYPDGEYSWYIMDKPYTFEKWCQAVDISDEEIVLLKLKYGKGLSSKYL